MIISKIRKLKDLSKFQVANDVSNVFKKLLLQKMNNSHYKE